MVAECCNFYLFWLNTAKWLIKSKANFVYSQRSILLYVAKCVNLWNIV